MLVLNKSLYKLGISVYVKYSKVNYCKLRTIFGLFIKKSNIENLIKHHLNTLIQVLKLIVKRIIRRKILEQWHKLIVYRMSSLRYFKKRKIEVLFGKIKFSIEIKFKSISQ